MRGLVADRIALRSTVTGFALTSRWLRAGFKSFAYRLAHLRVPQLAVLTGLSGLFFFI